MHTLHQQNNLNVLSILFTNEPLCFIKQEVSVCNTEMLR